jgi:HTH-type transcriptional regulator, osmoprotectant uptake regulator
MESIESEFAEFFRNVGKSYGLDDLPMNIFAVLYLEPEEISMEDIAKRTGYSLASVSNTMKILETALGVERIKKPKTKKVFFYMEKDLFKLNIIKLEIARQKLINPAKEKMPEIIARFKAKAKTGNDSKKLKIVENYYIQIVAFEEIIVKLKKDLENITLESLGLNGTKRIIHK